MVVTELPTTDIKANKIYLVKDSTTEGDLYHEYLYVDNKWEKIGTHKQEVDLTDYAKKSEAVKSLDISQDKTSNYLQLTTVNGTIIPKSALMPATSSSAGLMTADDKAKLDGIATDANKYTLPIASATALGGIKLGSGLSATSDGTVSVSADVVAGAVQWDSIENKPNVAILGDGEADGTNANSGRILFQTEGSDDYIMIGYDSDSYSMDVTRQLNNTSNSTYISSDGVSVSSSSTTGSYFNSITLNVDGILLNRNGEIASSNTVFMANGTTQELTAITTDELNEILV